MPDVTPAPAAGRPARTRRGAPVPAPWVRTRLRTSPARLLAPAVLVLVTAFLAAALPRAVEAYENRALRTSVERADLAQRSLLTTADVPNRAAGDTVPSAAAMRATDRAVRAAADVPLERDAVHGVRTTRPAVVLDAGLPPPSADLPQATLISQQQDLARHARLVTGRMPAARPAGDGADVEAAVTTRTAKVIRLRAGSTLRLASRNTEITVRISGIVQPRDPRTTYWRAESDLRRPGLRSTPSPAGPQYYWHIALFVDEGARAFLPRLGGATAYWHHPVRVPDLAAHDVPRLRRALASLTSGTAAARIDEHAPVPQLRTQSGEFDGLLDAFEAERRAAEPLVLTASLGVGTVAVVVLALAAGLAAAARRDELALLRARGAGLAGLGLRLLGETTAVAVPAAAAGTLLALALVPAERRALSLGAGCAVALLAALALPLRAVAAHRVQRPPGREDVATTRPSRRRTVIELTVLLLVVGALAALRSRGAEEADAFTAAAPVLLAVAVALVLLRLHPLPLRLLARPAARLTGAVLHVGVIRAARAPAAAALALPAVVVALTVTSFGGSVLAGVEDARDHAARAGTGADARIDVDQALPSGLAERIRQVPNVREVTAARIEQTMTSGDSLPFTLVAVDPAAYARLAARTGLDGGKPFPAAALRRSGEDVPAVVSPGLARALDRGWTSGVATDAGPTWLRAVAVRAETPAATGEFAVVSASRLAVAHPDAVGTRLLAPTALYVTGPGLDGDALRAAARDVEPDAAVTVRAEERARYDAAPLQAGARQVHLAAVAAGAAYSLLALLLALLRTAPERRTVLARLRTMGMSRRQAQGVALVETLPLLLTAAVGGALAGLVAVHLLRPDIDLTALAFTAAASTPEGAAAVLQPDPTALLVPAAGLLLPAIAALAIQTWLTGRRAPAAGPTTGEGT